MRFILAAVGHVIYAFNYLYGGRCVLRTIDGEGGLLPDMRVRKARASTPRHVAAPPAQYTQGYGAAGHVCSYNHYTHTHLVLILFAS